MACLQRREAIVTRRGKGGWVQAVPSFQGRSPFSVCPGILP